MAEQEHSAEQEMPTEQEIPVERTPTVEQPVEGVPPTIVQPLLRPLVRALLYLAACLAAGLVGLVIALVPYLFWLFTKYGPAGMEHAQSELGTAVFAATMVIYPLLILTTWLFVRFIDRRSLTSVGFQRQRWGKNCGLGAAVGVGFVLVVTVTYRLAGWIRLEPQALSYPLWILGTLVVYPLIGVTEEMVFRGYLLSTLDEWRGRRSAIVLTSILFWIVHIGNGQGSGLAELLGIPYYFATGIVFALCRYATGGLWFPIGLHAAFDWLLISLAGAPAQISVPAFFRAEPTVAPWLIGPPGTGGVIDLAFELLFLAGIYLFLYRPARKKEVASTGQSV